MWKSTLDSFISTWSTHEFFEGALVSGSFVTGDQVEKSDIDLHIVMSDKFHKRVKGVETIDGFKISYSVYPERMFNIALEQGRKEHERITARFFTKGTILEDKNGVIKTLKQRATEDLKLPLTRLQEPLVEQAKYIIVGVLEDLEKISDNDDYFCFVYYLLLEQVLRSYAMFLGIDIPNTVRSYAKLPQFFHDADWRKRYLINTWEDPIFLSLFEDALGEISMGNAHLLTEYVLEKMGGIDPENWKLVIPA